MRDSSPQQSSTMFFTGIIRYCLPLNPFPEEKKEDVNVHCMYVYYKTYHHGDILAVCMQCLQCLPL